MTSESNQTPSPVKTSAVAEATNSVPCGICRRQFSRYTCPKCNILYCSLTCFRSQAHSDCSESFYKNELETDIRTNSTKNAEERVQMIELLKRFEEEAAEDEDALFKADRDEDENKQDLADKIGEMDLEKVSYDELWTALTPGQQQKFLNALHDPSSEIAQSILSSEELAEEIILPWWDSQPDPVDRPLDQLSHQRFGHIPSLFEIPQAILKAATSTPPSGPSLLYNIFAVLIAYAYVTRSFSTSPLSSMKEGNPERDDARQTVSSLVPFLVDRKSKHVLPSLSGVITHIWSRFEPETTNSTLFGLLMRDAAKLLRPAAVVALPEAHPYASTNELNYHPSINTLLALSDLSSLFQSTGRRYRDSSKHSPPDPCTAKLAFYAARIIHTPTYLLNALSNEVLARASLIEREGMQEPESVPSSEPQSTVRLTHVEDDVRPRIEELP